MLHLDFGGYGKGASFRKDLDLNADLRWKAFAAKALIPSAQYSGPPQSAVLWRISDKLYFLCGHSDSDINDIFVVLGHRQVSALVPLCFFQIKLSSLNELTRFQPYCF